MQVLDNQLSSNVIEASIEVHRALGPGLLESIYESCLKHELLLRGHQVEQQHQVDIVYKGFKQTECLRCDLVVNGKLLIELKAVETILPVHKAQVITYLRLLNLPYGLLINFNQEKLVDGLSRLVNPSIRSATSVPSC